MNRLSIASITLLLLAAFLPGAEPLAWQNAKGYRWAELKVDPAGKTGFTSLPAATTGVTFQNSIRGERSITNRALLSGSGLAAGDVDGDGWCDLYFCNLDGPNVLYRNLGGTKFVAANGGPVECANQHSTASSFADVDGDGDLDLLVNALGDGTRLFSNDGKGGFAETTAATGLVSRAGSMSMALADVEGDGDLDLYVANFRPSSMQDEPRVRYRVVDVDGQPTVAAVNDRPASDPDLTNRFVVTRSGRVLEFGEPDALYLNDGKGRFTAASFTDGRFLDDEGKPMENGDGDWGLAALFYDFTGDGAPDLYVCNDLFTPDRIWINDGKGTFRALPQLALRCTSTFSMGADFGDLDRDGDMDFFVVDMLSREHQKRQVQVAEMSPMFWPAGLNEQRAQLSRNTLQINRGDGTFAETAFYSGVEASEWSWGPIFLDVDLDGYEDILITNGQFRDYQNADIARRIEATRGQKELTREDMLRLLSMYPEYASPNILFRNRGDLTFEEMGTAWGFGTVGISQGMALADIDNDGDCDVVVNNLNMAASIYRNDSPAPRIAVRLKGLAPNTRGTGAKIKISGGTLPAQEQEMLCGGRYLSGDDPIRVFAAGSGGKPLSIEVTWRSGKKSIIKEAAPNRIYELDEAVASPAKGSPAPINEPLFRDVSDLIKHTHHESAFDDFERQPLLPYRLSRLGPGVAWYDINSDGSDELIIGSGRGGRMAIYRNDGKGGFTALTNALLARPVPRDQTAVLGMGDAVLIGASNYEDGSTNGGWVRVYNFQRQAAGDSILGPTAATGPMAVADIDHDGDLDLFVGGRAMGGRYPEPADSLLMRNDNGRLTLAQRLDKLGLVSGAVWSDLDGDGNPELVLACEWSPIRIFAVKNGKLVERNENEGLHEHKGWWNGVTTGDFNNDGRMDIVASNWGLNSRYRPTQEHPCHAYYADVDANDTVEIIQTYFDPLMRKDVPERNLKLFAIAMPLITERIKTFEQYGHSGVQELFPDELKNAQRKEATSLATMVFLNRGNRFEPLPLPMEAQLAPAFGISVADFDGDGNEDIFLAQNLFAVNPELGRLDAGRGLVLRGNGKGAFAPMPAQLSGVSAYGEQRGCAVADFDGDGRADLVATQNAAPTRLYQNQGGKPGLRVRLKGVPGNELAVGATLRLKSGDRHGPAREIHGGSGYWSQDSGVQVMSSGQPATHIQVRWPDGHETTSPLPRDAKEVLVEPTGSLKQTR